MTDKTFVIELLRQQSAPQSWVCKDCAEIVDAGTLCPKCDANRTILITEGDARKIVSLFDESMSEIIDLENQLEGHYP